MDIQLNFINQSNDSSNSQIVIFQKNVAIGANGRHVAWIVIRNCDIGENHPFKYPETIEAGVGDSDGNYLPRLDAEAGDRFAVTLTGSGDTLARKGAATRPTEVQICNDLEKGTIRTDIYRDGRLLATRTGVAPQQMAAFEFMPTLWIGVASQAEQGAIMDSAIVDTINTELSLLGIASADIVMTGGGPGVDSQPFQFSLGHVVFA